MDQQRNDLQRKKNQDNLFSNVVAKPGEEQGPSSKHSKEKDEVEPWDSEGRMNLLKKVMIAKGMVEGVFDNLSKSQLKQVFER